MVTSIKKLQKQDNNLHILNLDGPEPAMTQIVDKINEIIETINK